MITSREHNWRLAEKRDTKWANNAAVVWSIWTAVIVAAIAMVVQ